MCMWVWVCVCNYTFFTLQLSESAWERNFCKFRCSWAHEPIEYPFPCPHAASEAHLCRGRESLLRYWSRDTQRIWNCASACTICISSPSAGTNKTKWVMIWVCGLTVAALPGIILAQWIQSRADERSLFLSLPLTCWMASGKSFNSLLPFLCSIHHLCFFLEEFWVALMAKGILVLFWGQNGPATVPQYFKSL